MCMCVCVCVHDDLLLFGLAQLQVCCVFVKRGFFVCVHVYVYVCACV